GPRWCCVPGPGGGECKSSFLAGEQVTFHHDRQRLAALARGSSCPGPRDRQAGEGILGHKPPACFQPWPSVKVDLEAGRATAAAEAHPAPRDGHLVTQLHSACPRAS